MTVNAGVVPRRRVLTLWAVDAPGADFWEENNGGRRVFWAPGGVNNPYALSPTGVYPTGTTYYGASVAQGDFSAGDGTYGGPDVRPEHIFRIPVRGFDELWIQWAGELVSFAGITSNRGTALTRTFVGTNIHAFAYGMPVSDSERSYASLPPVLCYALSQQGKSSSVMGNYVAGGATSGEACGIAGGHSLWVTSPGFAGSDVALNDARRSSGREMHQPLFGQQPLFRATLAKHIWGYSENTGTDISRFPVAGDRYGFILKIGLPPTFGTDAHASPWPTADYGGGVQIPIPIQNAYGGTCDAAGELRVTGLDTVFFALMDQASGWTTDTTYGGAGTTHAFIKGRLRAVLVSHTPGIPWGLIDERPDWR